MDKRICKEISGEVCWIGGKLSVVLQEIRICKALMGNKIRPNIVGGRLAPKMKLTTMSVIRMARLHRDRLAVKPNAQPSAVLNKLGRLARWAEKAVTYRIASHLGVAETFCLISWYKYRLISP